MLALQRSIEVMPHKFGFPGAHVYGYNMKLLDDSTGAELGADQKCVAAIDGPLLPACTQTVPGKMVYSTFGCGIKDKDGYFFILGRTDDVINMPGHFLGTHDVEKSISSHPNAAELAVVGIEDKLNGQVAIGFAIAKDADNTATLEAEILKIVDS